MKTQIRPFSRRQLELLTWWVAGSGREHHDAVICDGAIRSGKTFCMSLSFVTWATFRFHGQAFALCGKTIGSLRRNLVTPLLRTLSELGFHCKERVSKNMIEIGMAGRVNRFYLFGGRDESSCALIQGITLAGVLFDEVALMPRTFVEQALARCSVAGSTFWFSCNPEHPYHWFYREWIEKVKEKNALYLHFTMEDNPSLSPDIIRRYEALYTGSFYDRFIKGIWTNPFGVIYPMFDSSEHLFMGEIEPCRRYAISCDYGTLNPTSMGLWGEKDGVWYRLREVYHDGRRTGVLKTDEEYYAMLTELAGDRPIEAVVIDPSAASFITCIERHGRFYVRRANNAVLEGIQRVSEALQAGRIRIHTSCKDTIREFSLYRWEENALHDTPHKQYDHAMDDIRYFVLTFLQEHGDSFFVGAPTRETRRQSM